MPTVHAYCIMTTLQPQFAMDSMECIPGSMPVKMYQHSSGSFRPHLLAVSNSDIDSLGDLPDVGADLEQSGILDTAADGGTPNSLKSFDMSDFNVEDSSDSLPFDGILGLPDRTSSAVPQNLLHSGGILCSDGWGSVPFLAQFPLESAMQKQDLAVLGGPNLFAPNLPATMHLVVNKGIVSTVYKPDGSSKFVSSILSGSDENRKLASRSRSVKSKLSDGSGPGLPNNRDAPEYQRVMDILTEYRVQIAEKSAESLMPCKRRKSRPLVDSVEAAKSGSTTLNQSGAVSTSRHNLGTCFQLPSLQCGSVTELFGDISSSDSVASSGSAIDLPHPSEQNIVSIASTNGHFIVSPKPVTSRALDIALPQTAGSQELSYDEINSISSSSHCKEDTFQYSEPSFVASSSVSSVENSSPDKSSDVSPKSYTRGLEAVPQCQCSDTGSYDESKDGPYYTQLGAASNIDGVRQLMETRLGIHGDALRIEKLLYVSKEGKNPVGCPMAKWILRHSGPDEKALCLVRQRRGHTCQTAVVIIAVILWEGLDTDHADQCYDYLTDVLPNDGVETERRCGLNEQRTCACQGWDPAVGGVSFTYGCLWSIFHGGCKFARSPNARRFRLRNQLKEAEFEKCIDTLATKLAPLCETAVPDAYKNMVEYDSVAGNCRLGSSPSAQRRPFSGVTAVLDYCTHSHKDISNMHAGCTAVVSLTKHRGDGPPDDEQLHVLPFCALDSSLSSGHGKGVEELSRYPMTMRIRDKPYQPQPRYRFSSARSSSRKQNMSSPGGSTFRMKAMKRKHSCDDVLSVFHGPELGVTSEPSGVIDDSVSREIGSVFRQRSLSLADTEHSYYSPDSGSRSEIIQVPETMLSRYSMPCPVDDPKLDSGVAMDPVVEPSLGRDSSLLTTATVDDMPGIKSEPCPNVGNVHMNNSINSSSVQQQAGTTSEMETTGSGSGDCHCGIEAGTGNGEVSFHVAVNDLDCEEYKSCKVQNEEYKVVQNIDEKYKMSTAQTGEMVANLDVEPKNKELISQSHSAGKISKKDCIRGRDVDTDCAESFLDADVGGVAVALTHGSVMFEVAKREVHATTMLRRPSRHSPTRLSLVFYQHRGMNRPNHGAPLANKTDPQANKTNAKCPPHSTPPAVSQDQCRTELKSTVVNSADKVNRTCPTQFMRVNTLTTTTTVTKWIKPQPVVSGPYQCWG